MSSEARMPHKFILQVVKESSEKTLQKLSGEEKTAFMVFIDYLEVEIKAHELSGFDGIEGKEFGTIIFKSAEEADLISIKTPANLLNLLNFFNIFNEEVRIQARKVLAEKRGESSDD